MPEPEVIEEMQATNRASLLPLRAHDVRLYRFSEILTEGLLYLMVIFSPWAFGTTQTWSTWVMNGAGYLLGVLLVLKLFIRWGKGYQPARWDGTPGEGGALGLGWLTSSRLTRVLAGLTLALLGYCLLSAVNARSTYRMAEMRFDLHNHLLWLPHSFDSARTWFAFWSYLGLAYAFWAVRDWLLGKATREELAEHQKLPLARRHASPFPARLRRLLWVLCLNGAVVGVESIAQRVAQMDAVYSPGKLLWLVEVKGNPQAYSQFGPYAYRSNAAQFFNLLWPVCLGAWWTWQRFSGGTRSRHHALLLCGAILAAGPIISSSRNGAIVAMLILVLALAYFFISHWASANHAPGRGAAVAWVVLFGGVALSLGGWLGWKTLEPRLLEIRENFRDREQMFTLARPMAADYPVFGTGPGTFSPVFQLYRPTSDAYWPAQLHNDFLETRITFGAVGSALIALALAVVILRWFAPGGGLQGGRSFVVCLWLALLGCLIQARFDFPFQVHSILFLFLLLCAVLFSLTRRA